MTRRTPAFVYFTLFAVALVPMGCGGGDSAGAGTVPPASSGQVWEVDGPADRAAVPGAVVAFVNGLHVMVLDGDSVYAGMTEMKATPGSQGVRTVTLPSGLAAEFSAAGKDVQLRFSTGEAVIVRERAASAE